ncbi:hypothetical protein ACOSQ4_018852 [Xanthoceras sorbifolium]
MANTPDLQWWRLAKLSGVLMGSSLDYGISSLDSVSFKIINHSTGKIVSSGTHDGTGGVLDKISIDKSEEHLTLISGTIIDNFGKVVVESLTFHTNKTKYGPYGLTNGSTFEIPMKNGEIVGFFGNAGAFLDTVGIYLKTSAN